jgi:hypothetical protein
MQKLVGDDLRDSIAQLLRMKFQVVEVERRLRATTADIFFIDDTNPIFPRTIAIEAKDWKNRLPSEDIATIYNLYAPSLTEREIDFVWIVGRVPLSSSPKHTLEHLRGLKYSTFDEFRASLMNFTGMMQNNILLFEHDDASKYFVNTRVRNSDITLFDHVTKWLSSERNGLIVYGGYGLGKTTFSLHLAATLSKSHINGEFDRIPIRIALACTQNRT